MARRSRRLCHHRLRNWNRPPRTRLRRSRLRSPHRAKRTFCPGPRPRVDLRRRTRREIQRRCGRLPRSLGQRRRSTHQPSPTRARVALAPRTICSRLPILLASKPRPTDPVPTRKLVHPHDRIPRCHARKQLENRLVTRAHRSGPLRQLPRIQRRLGAVPRTLLGNPTAGLGLSVHRENGVDRILPRTLVKTRHRWNRSVGQGQGSQSRTGRGSQGPQTLHRRGDLRFTVCTRCPHGASHRSDRLLVRQRCDALCAVGISPYGQNGVRVPISSRFHQRGDRPNSRLVLLATGYLHDALRPTTGANIAGSIIAGAIIAEANSIGLSASVSKLHRPGVDAGRVVREQGWQAAVLDRRGCSGLARRGLCPKNRQDEQATAKLP